MWLKKFYFLSIFALFAVLFGSFIITSGNVSAVSDISVTYTQGTTVSDGQSIFPSCDSTCLSDFHFLKIESNSTVSANTSFRITFNSFNYIYQRPIFTNDSSSWYVIFPLPFSSSTTNNSILFYGSSSSFNVPLTYTYTLIDSLSNCPSCPTCPAVPDNPYDPKFDEIKQAILIIPATALVIYFFFCIYRMLLKGRE